MIKYSVLIDGAVVESGLPVDVAEYEVWMHKASGFTNPTMRCEFVVQDAAYSNNWQEHATIEDALFDMWFELSEVIDVIPSPSTHPRYTNQPALYLMG